MLDIIFIQPPVAPVYLTQNKEDIQKILNDNISQDIITILPRKSFSKFILIEQSYNKYINHKNF